MSALVVRLALLCVLPVLLLLFASAMPGINPLWDFANVAGLFCAVLMLTLFIYSGRPLALPYFDGKFFMNLHRDLGFAATLLLVVHVGVLLISEPLVIDYLKPSASWPMLSGTLSLVPLLLLVPASLPGVRQRIWGNQRRFRRWHYVLGTLMLVLISLHVLGAGFYTRDSWKGFVWSGLVGVAIAWPLLPKAPLPRGHGPRRRRTASYASWLCLALVLLALAGAAGYALLANSDLPL